MGAKKAMAKAWFECPATRRIILYDEKVKATEPAAASHGLKFKTMNKK